MSQATGETIRVRKVVPATKERVFRAWTDPSQVKRWWTLGERWHTTFVEMDLRAGGKFRLGNEPADGPLVLITGEFLVIQPPDRLVYTWRFHTPTPENSIVTVEFRGVDDATEVVVTQEHTLEEMGPSAEAGWNAALSSLGLHVGGPGDG